MRAQARVATLSDFVLPRAGILREVLLIVGFACFTAVAAQISFTPPSWYADLFGRIGIPIAGTPVPVTGQTLAVVMTGAALGSRRALMSMLLYLLAGIAGLPIYAGAMEKVISGEVAFGATGGSLWSTTLFWALPSGGYIIGFVAAAYFVGRLAEQGWDRSVGKIFLALLAGNIIIYLAGLPWLYAVLSQRPDLGMDLAKTLNFGLWPFIPGDAVKLLIAAGVLPSAWAFVQRFR